jgi:hypothetical protein
MSWIIGPEALAGDSDGPKYRTILGGHIVYLALPAAFRHLVIISVYLHEYRLLLLPITTNRFTVI